MDIELEVLSALQRFEPNFAVDASGVDSNILERVLSKNVKISYYIRSASTSVSYFGGRRIVFDVEYDNTDIPLKDIHIVSTGEEIQNLLCRYIGDYKSRLVLLMRSNIDIELERQKFRTVHAPFYPNYRNYNLLFGTLLCNKMADYDFSFNYRIGKVKLSMMEIDVDREVERLAKQMFLPGMSDETKALLAHNYLAYTIEYTLKENTFALIDVLCFVLQYLFYHVNILLLNMLIVF